MPQQQFYATITPLTGGMNVLLWVPNEGATYKTSLTALSSYFFMQASGQNYSKTEPVTFDELPDPSEVGTGARAFITDCNSATFNAIAAGGGSDEVPVFVGSPAVWRVG